MAKADGISPELQAEIISVMTILHRRINGYMDSLTIYRHEGKTHLVEDTLTHLGTLNDRWQGAMGLCEAIGMKYRVERAIGLGLSKAPALSEDEPEPDSL